MKSEASDAKWVCPFVHLSNWVLVKDRSQVVDRYEHVQVRDRNTGIENLIGPLCSLI